jgi:hypothetical protein
MTLTKEKIMIGQGNCTQRIERWMTGVVLGPNTPAGGLRLRLYHVPIGGGQRLLRTWELECIPDQQAFRELVEETDSTAAEEAKELGWGTQRFTLSAETVNGAPLGSVALQYAATTLASGEGSFLDSEPASRDGLIAMCMRHTNMAFQIAENAHSNSQDFLIRFLLMAEKEKARSQEAQAKVYETRAQLADKAFEREVVAETKKKQLEIELHREVAQLDRSQMFTKLAMERLAPLIPAVMNRVFGQGTVPAATTSRDEMMAGIFETLTEEQLVGIQNVLNPGQMANLAMLFEELQAARTGRKTGAAGPEAPGQSGRPSEETAYLAIAHIKKDVLPWAIECIKEGKPLAPPITLSKPIRIFQLFMGNLSRQQYEELVNGDVAFNPAEKDAFVKLAETFNLVPLASKDATAKTNKEPGAGSGQARK